MVFNELLLVVKMSDSATRLLDESEWNANRESAPAVVSMGGNVQVVGEKVVAPRSLRSAAAASESEEDTADVSLVATSEAHPASRKRAVDEDIADDLYTRDVKKALAARVLAPDELNTPKNLREALASPDVSMWNEAIASEIKSLVSNKTFKVIPRKGLRVHTLGTKWVFKIKHDKYGNVARYKARCTALGNLQREGVDYDETYSPVVRHSSLRLLLSIAAQRNMPVHQMDVDTAFLYGEFSNDDPPVYLTLPYNYPIPPELQHYSRDQLVCKVEKGLYGLKQSPRLWNKSIDATMQKHGFRRFASDPCLYVRKTGKQVLYVGIYVDDLVIAGSDIKCINVFKKQLSEVYNMKDLGPINHLLGMEVSQDLCKGTLKISQATYIGSILRRFSLGGAKHAFIPMRPDSNLRKAEVCDDEPYAQLVGSLLYLTSCTRPDIAYAVNMLTRYISCHDDTHMEAARMVCRYLSGTVSLGITYTRCEPSEYYLRGYSDSDFGSDKETRRSVTGYVFLMGTGVISWKSKSQHTVALSSTEAEYMALGATVTELLYLKRLVREFGCDSKVQVYGDNISSLCMVENPTNHEKTKHIDVRHHFIREHYAAKEFLLEHLPTGEMIADMLTKPLARILHEKHVNKIMS